MDLQSYLDQPLATLKSIPDSIKSIVVGAVLLGAVEAVQSQVVDGGMPKLKRFIPAVLFQTLGIFVVTKSIM